MVTLRSSGRVVPPLGAGRSPTDEFKREQRMTQFILRPLSRYIFLLGCLFLLLYAIYYQRWLIGIITLILWSIRYVYQLFVFQNTSKDLKERRYTASLLFFDLLQPLWNFRYKLIWLFRRKSDFILK